MYTINEREGWYYLEKNGRQLTSLGGNRVRTMFKDLAERLVVDLEKYGESPSSPVSLVAFHYSMLDFFVDGNREDMERQIIIGFDRGWDWTLTCPSGNPDLMMEWMSLFGRGETQIENGIAWVKTLTKMQLCAVTVIGAYFESVNIPYLVATLISAKELKKYVQQIQRFQIWVSVEDGTKALENFLFYFNVDENPD